MEGCVMGLVLLIIIGERYGNRNSVWFAEIFQIAANDTRKMRSEKVERMLRSLATEVLNAENEYLFGSRFGHDDEEDLRAKRQSYLARLNEFEHAQAVANREGFRYSDDWRVHVGRKVNRGLSRVQQFVAY